MIKVYDLQKPIEQQEDRCLPSETEDRNKKPYENIKVFRWKRETSIIKNNRITIRFFNFNVRPTLHLRHYIGRFLNQLLQQWTNIGPTLKIKQWQTSFPGNISFNGPMLSQHSLSNANTLPTIQFYSNVCLMQHFSLDYCKKFKIMSKFIFGIGTYGELC